VLAGDERTDRILAVVDEQANYGTVECASLIAALTGAGCTCSPRWQPGRAG
jgi:hypothetical protein